MPSFLFEGSLLRGIEWASAFSERQWLISVILFCVLHWLTSTTGIPGGCTLLNTLGGAVFGFTMGCAIVYPITLFSAAVMYAVGYRTSRGPIGTRYRTRAESLLRRLGRADFVALVGLRLSPIFPFAAVNFASGWVRLPFGLFMTTTAVGIFFDVTLLNALGEALRHGTHARAADEFFPAFLFVLSGLWILRSLLFKGKERMRL